MEEAGLGVNDTRYEGPWDAVHAIWPAEYFARGSSEGAQIFIDGDLADWDQLSNGNYLAQLPFYHYNAYEATKDPKDVSP